jgi:hypothetical protein
MDVVAIHNKLKYSKSIKIKYCSSSSTTSNLLKNKSDFTPN